MESTPPDQDDRDAGRADDSSGGPPAASARAGRGDSAFELWLQRELRKMFSAVAREPIPEALLRLIDADKSRRKDR